MKTQVQELPQWPNIWPANPNIGVNNEDGDAVFDAHTVLKIIRVTGFPGSGKTSFGLRLIARKPGDPTPPVVVWDTEGSSSSFEQKYAMKRYDMSAYTSGIAAHDAWVEQVDNIVPGQYAVAIIDVGEDWEEWMETYVRENIGEFGLSRGQAFEQDGKAKPLFYGALKAYIKKRLMILASKVQTLVITNHVAQEWNGPKPVPGKFKPKGKDTIGKLATLSVWLIGDGLNAPSAVVLKNRLDISDWEQVDDFGVPALVQVFPPFMPKFTAADLRNYMENPRTFTAREMEKVDPSTIALSPAELNAQLAEIEEARLGVAKLQAEQQLRVERDEVIAALIKAKLFKNRDELIAAARNAQLNYAVMGRDAWEQRLREIAAEQKAAQ